MACEYTVNARPEEVYAAWTKRFDTWFAQAGTLAMVPEPGRPYFFLHVKSSVALDCIIIWHVPQGRPAD